MVYILNIETATKNCSISISADGELLACKEIAEQNFSHAEKLHLFIEELLNQFKLSFKDLNAVSVSQGPGSYTGLRIGVSSAKGFCYALQLPLIAVNTLEVLAHQLKVDGGIIIPMLDARRMEVFTAVYSSQYIEMEPTKALILEADSLERFNSETVHLIGDGALKCKELFSENNFVFHDDIIYPSAKNMVTLSWKKFQNKDFVDVAYFEPFYLKDFVMTTKKK